MGTGQCSERERENGSGVHGMLCYSRLQLQQTNYGEGKVQGGAQNEAAQINAGFGQSKKPHNGERKKTTTTAPLQAKPGAPISHAADEARTNEGGRDFMCKERAHQASTVLRHIKSNTHAPNQSEPKSQTHPPPPPPPPTPPPASCPT